MTIPCQKLGMLDMEKRAGVNISVEWTDSEIVCFGAN
jgi:hypothetical protein